MTVPNKKLPMFIYLYIKFFLSCYCKQMRLSDTMGVLTLAPWAAWQKIQTILIIATPPKESKIAAAVDCVFIQDNTPV